MDKKNVRVVKIKVGDRYVIDEMRKKGKDIDTLEVKKHIRKTEEKLGEKGRVLVRYSGTENLCRVMIEGEYKKEIQKRANEIARGIKREIGV